MTIAIFTTWTTYGSWLPGDTRGWFERSLGLRKPNLLRELESQMRLADDSLILDAEQRRIVEATIADHCAIRKWNLHAVNCRTNHVHVAVTAHNCAIGVPREQFKAWCTRKLKDRARELGDPIREDWWTERGWDVYLDHEAALLQVIDYILNHQ